VAEIYRIKERGYIREGYFADLVLLDLNREWKVSPENTLYKCQWSPLNGQVFKSYVKKTFVNGNMVYDRGLFNETNNGHRLKFEKFR
jgi:dihydroorotase